jgi:hypothetical protein
MFLGINHLRLFGQILDTDRLYAGRSGDRGSIPGEMGIFLNTISKPALGLTQPRVQWVPGYFSLE